MKFTLEIEMDNAAFFDYPGELGALLRWVSHAVPDVSLGQHRACVPYGTVRDSNGNTVGSWEIG